MEETPQNILRRFNPRSILLPVFIGIGAAAFLFYLTFDFKNFNVEKFRQDIYNAHNGWLLFIAVLILVRQFGYMYRIRYIAGGALNFWQSFQIISLWEFASAVSPTAVGGAAVSVFFLNREKIGIGKSTAYVVLTTLLDGVFYISGTAFIFLWAGYGNIFPSPEEAGRLLQDIPFHLSLVLFFFISWSAYAFYCLVCIYILFAQPESMRLSIEKVFRLPLIRRVKQRAVNECENLIITAREIRGKSFRYWAHVFGSTFLVWIARFLLINALIAAFYHGADHLLIFARQFVLWAILLFAPTPGASGIAEITFPALFGKFFANPDLLVPVVFFWRVLTYYPYLLLGAFILPRWIRRVFSPPSEASSLPGWQAGKSQ